MTRALPSLKHFRNMLSSAAHMSNRVNAKRGGGDAVQIATHHCRLRHTRLRILAAVQRRRCYPILRKMRHCLSALHAQLRNEESQQTSERHGRAAFSRRASRRAQNLRWYRYKLGLSRRAAHRRMMCAHLVDHICLQHIGQIQALRGRFRRIEAAYSG